MTVSTLVPTQLTLTLRLFVNLALLLVQVASPLPQHVRAVLTPSFFILPPALLLVQMEPSFQLNPA